MRRSHHSYSYFCGPLGWQSFFCDQFHLFTESIELAQRWVQIRRDPNALEFCVHDRRGEDVMLVEQIFRYSLRIGAVDVNISDRARLVRIERSVKPNLGHVLEPVHPVTRQIT